MAGFKEDAENVANFEATNDNYGYLWRRSLFLSKNEENDQEYKKDTTKLMGKLFTDWSSKPTYVPPRTSIRIALRQSSDDFR